MPNVFFTWLGPPQQATKTVTGLPGMHRPDLFGILRTAGSSFSNNPPPRFTLCVLKKFKAQFDAQLPRYIETRAVEDSFSSAGYHTIQMSKPNLEDLDQSVDFIIRETIKVRGTGYDASLLPYRQLAFVKDLWSLFCIWKFGGYHLDSGVYPLRPGAVLNFPEPTGFDVPSVDAVDCRGSARHCRASFRTGEPMCITLTNKESLLESKAMKGRIVATGSPSHLQRLLDVWLMRSPAGDPAVRRALTVYVRGWFEIQSWLKAAGGDADPQELFRELSVVAAMTGITHSGGTCSSTSTEVGSHIINGFNKEVRDLGLKKVGFRSHR